MRLYEFEGKILLQKSGIPVPKGIVVTTIKEGTEAASTIGYPVAIKSQILKGGRGKGGGIKFAEDEAGLIREAGDLFSLKIGDEKIDRLLIEEKIPIEREWYAGITLDPQHLQPFLMVSTEGGMDIEEVAQKSPDKLFTRLLHPLEPPNLDQMMDLVLQIRLHGEERFQVANVILKLVQAYFRYEALSAEINPLVLCKGGRRVIAADAKFEIDDSALNRVKEIKTFVRREDGMDSLEREAQKEDISYVRMPGGNIGIICNGAGLGMATMDMISLHGGRPANFLDLGGDATEKKTAAALRIILKTPGVDGILLNAFGGINNCEQTARGFVSVMDELHPTQVIVAKMRGHFQEEGWSILESRKIAIVKFGTTEEAVVLLLEKMKKRKSSV